MRGIQNDPVGYCWTGWPPRPTISIYSLESHLLIRSRKPKFDLTDNWARYSGYSNFIRLGISSQSLRKINWTQEELSRQEDNIRYDLSEDGYQVEINRLKGIDLPCSEEALWELHIFPQ